MFLTLPTLERMSGSFASEQRFDTEARAHSRRQVPSPREPRQAVTMAYDLHARRVEKKKKTVTALSTTNMSFAHNRSSPRLRGCQLIGSRRSHAEWHALCQACSPTPWSNLRPELVDAFRVCLLVKGVRSFIGILLAELSKVANRQNSCGLVKLQQQRCNPFTAFALCKQLQAVSSSASMQVTGVPTRILIPRQHSPSTSRSADRSGNCTRTQRPRGAKPNSREPGRWLSLSPSA